MDRFLKFLNLLENSNNHNTVKAIKQGYGIIFENSESLPLKTIKNVFHVGTMDIGKKSEYSFEGSGLSVSNNPDEWRKIAKLGGDLYSLSKLNGVFVDVHEISNNQITNIISWGIKNGYVLQEKTYKVRILDEEGEEGYMEFPTYGEAKKETYDDEDVIINTEGIKPTDKLKKETRQARIAPNQSLELLLTIYIEKNTDYDGIWWEDTLDVSRYSAPRGVIFNSKISEWKADKK